LKKGRGVMHYKDYDQLINRLKQVQPKPASPVGLTGSIMNSIIDQKVGKRRFIILKASHSQWLWFNGFRVITSAAAIFLIGFFLLQQSEINTKLSRLEDQVAMNQHPQGFDDHGVAAEFQKVKLFLPDSVVNSMFDSVQTDMLQINRRSLSFMLQKIQQLENENTSFREKLQQYYTDSTLFKPLKEKK
jgi:hypothetical protein